MTWLVMGFSSAWASPVDAPPPVLQQDVAAITDAVMRALSSRDPVSCEVIEALTPTPTATLLTVVNEVQRPPWAPMRAANCLLLNHAAEVTPDIERWVVAPELAGLGRLVLGSLDQMPLSVALPVAQKALALGPDRALVEERLAGAAVPELRALVVKP